jgi:ABC-2 type transport system permease protein
MNVAPDSSPLRRWRRYASLYAALWRNSVVREMMFKANFLLWIVVELLWFALQLTFMAVLYRHTDSIGGWSKWQVVALVGTSHFIQQIFQAFFLTNLTQLSELVRTGKLDFMLLLPVNTRFVISLRQVDLGGFVNAGTGLAVILYALVKMQFVPGVMQVVWFAVLCVAGVMVHYSLMFLLASVSFWTVKAQGIVWGYYSMFNIARMPDAAFRGAFKVIFTFALPMLLVSNVPARRLLGMTAPAMDLLILVGLCLAALVVSEMVFRFSIRRYTSASS